MTAAIEQAGAEGDSVGGVLETYVYGMPAGVGEPFFDSVESMLSHALFSIPGIKGVEFGLGFGFAERRGSEANDPFYFDGDTVKTRTNNNGGINGGITNGMPIVFRCAVRPTPSIFKEQETVSLSRGDSTVLKIEGRHDPAIIHRARAVVDAVCAITLADLLIARYGTDYFTEDKR
jgi:chorismate synthase